MIADLVAVFESARALTKSGEVDITQRDSAVSQWSVAQHLEHALRALRGSLAAAAHIRAGKAQVADGETSSDARQVLEEGRIPSGASAPERTLPDPAPERAAIERLLDRAASQIGDFEGWDPERESANGSILHHDLGPMNARQWLEFGAIHTRHHLAIIHEILASEACGRTSS